MNKRQFKKEVKKFLLINKSCKEARREWNIVTRHYSDYKKIRGVEKLRQKKLSKSKETSKNKWNDKDLFIIGAEIT